MSSTPQSPVRRNAKAKPEAKLQSRSRPKPAPATPAVASPAPPQAALQSGSANGAFEEQFPETAAQTPLATEPVGNEGHQPVTVRIEVKALAAQRAFLAGTFNNWCPDRTEMVSDGQGNWARVLALMPGVHEYRLVVDGRWMTDPASTRTVANPFGETNSLIVAAHP
jgi:hypothetical protein